MRALSPPRPVVSIRGLSKCFILHQRQSAHLPVLAGLDLDAQRGECLALEGPSGLGKSSLLKLIYGNYRASSGRIEVADATGRMIDVTTASPRAILGLRRDVIGYVSQFLRVIPRVCALDILVDELLDRGVADPQAKEAARDRAAEWLARLRIPQRLWSLPPATFSGGEQQRINIARSLIRPRPLLLVDEPTASLDAQNAATVIEILREALTRGSTVIAVFHDPSAAGQLGARRIDLARYRARS